MKITNAEFLSSDRKAKISGGLYIIFLSKDNIIKGSNIQILYGDKPHYFEVTDIAISGENLEIKAKEVGYYARKFDNFNDFDLRNLIGIDVSIVTDSALISKIHEMSCWL